MPPSRIDKIKTQNLWLRKLCNVEQTALQMCVPIDLATCDPEVIVVGKGAEQALFDYWRVVLSSEPQSSHFAGAGRTLSLLVRDRVSGGFLGVVALSDPPNHWTQLINHLGWTKENDHLRIENQHRIVMMRRCLPVYEFGQMTGGKLLALAATSRDVMRLLELRYSYQYMLFGIRTLHGKGSQYNRLNARGIELIDVDETGHGFYAMQLRKKAVPFLRGETDVSGKGATFSLADQISYWKERWLPARMESLSVTSQITLDPSRYRLSEQLDRKKLTPENLSTMEGDDGIEPQEETDE